MMPHDPVRNHPSVAEALSKARRVLARGQSAIVPLPLPLLLLLLVFFAMPARADHAALATPVPPLPQRLHDTGLYVDGAPGLLVRADNLPYAPQYPLWTDGARKRRWIHLPPGSWIDASDPDAWAKFCAGEGKALGALMGRVMKATKGKADGKAVNAAFAARRDAT